ncbi:HPr family phosphocarrier protein [Alicyclobacillus cycloheptanicus]|jgi:phosphotransferase system HPr (HPr) family protein|uniref:Phosphotransferase system HPr (HPr) family protein n=1 Tax=Alicyclobacillus cycloheptanicus TaxID=1457 RepID=A0ABT9XM23_9BACL|nr:HPr family phosphocarrier protein [Alicyclobacillus cycloheptanicus]MDQ0191366.1 phosphotransferase system HPr (HPr) family protein [Alicyclobacillus cycloheptanicus]WDL99845.1 HPr family phosphocarrier protein [Alicyclobacillus cycloheptanicus]
MVERRVVVRLRTGLLARPAALFVQEANRFSCDTFVEKDGKSVNAKSIMGIMSLAIAHGQEITVRAEGSDAQQAVERLAEMVSKED